MRQYVIDAFTGHVFAGNPAAVCLMDRWLDEAKMMAITIENNLSETAFAVREGEKYHLRWFTPGGTLYCTQEGDRIRMSGNAAVYSVADIRID